MAALDHVGIAIDEVESVLERFEELLDLRSYKAETVSEQQVRTHFLDVGTTKLELLEALEGDSPIQRFLDRHGEGLHHLAFSVDDADAALERVRTAGYRVLSDTPQAGADDKRIFFVHPKDTHGVLVEFCEATSPSWSPRRIPRGNGSLALYERGDPAHPPLLLLHGAAGSTRLETAPLFRQLESSFHVFGLDLSGHGASSFPSEGALTMDRFVQDVEATLSAIDEPSCSLFGFSMGASVALRVAAAHPDRIDRLALFAPNEQWDDEVVRQMKARLDLDTLREQVPEWTDQFLSLHDDPSRLLRLLRAFIDTLPRKTNETEETFSTLSVPTLVGAFDQDPLFSLEASQRIYEHLPNARLAVLPGRRHGLTDGPPGLLASLLREHLLAP